MSLPSSETIEAILKRLIILAILALPIASFAANQAVLTWTYDLVAWPGTFDVYQAEQGQPKVKTLSGLSGLTTTVGTGLVTGKTYCWQIKAVVAGVESDLSNEACKTFPPSPALTVK